MNLTLTDLLRVFSQVWVKPPWSRKPVKLCRPQEWEWKGFTPRRSEKGAGEWALMSSRWRGSEASCPESGTEVAEVSQSNQTACLPSSSCLDSSSSCLSGRGGPAASHSKHTVGPYAVDLPSFERVALPLFRNLRSAARSSTKVFVIDEIGKMELFSQSFVRAVSQTLDSPCVILGTIPVPKGRPLGLVEEVRSRRDVKVFHVSKENRDALLPDIVAALQECLQHSAA
uniref:Nucleoside-triphosphatase, cancer-related n=1 Tax=Oryzias sinensis TaxID=183150 RepID=A0A8C7Z1N5_9TELE